MEHLVSTQLPASHCATCSCSTQFSGRQHSSLKFDLGKLSVESLDSVIGVHEAQLVSLRRQRNTLAGISSLPSEITIEIFHLALDSEAQTNLRRAERSSSAAKGRFGRSWMAVCSAWRTLAIATPSLWTSLDSRYLPSQVEAYLEHSQSSPLDTFIHVPEGQDLGDSKTLWTAVLTVHCSRITSLTLSGSPMNVRGVLRDRYGPLNSLQSLSIHYHLDSLNAEPGALQEITAPHLQHLSLEACTIPWKSSLLGASNRLQTLHLSHCDNPPDITWEEFVASLRALSTLRELYFNQCYLEITDDSTTDFEVELVMLEGLTVIQPWPACLVLLRAIRFPKTCSLELDCSGFPAYPSASPSVIRELAVILQTHAGALFGVAEIDFATAANISVGTKRAGKQFELSFPWCNTDRPIYDTLDAIRPFLSELSTPTLRLVGPRRSIDIISDFLEALKSLWEANGPLIPRLEGLQLKRIHALSPPRITLSTMIACLCSGAQIETLWLRDCEGLTSDDIDELTELVPNIVQDGHVHGRAVVDGQGDKASVLEGR